MASCSRQHARPSAALIPASFILGLISQSTPPWSLLGHHQPHFIDGETEVPRGKWFGAAASESVATAAEQNLAGTQRSPDRAFWLDLSLRVADSSTASPALPAHPSSRWGRWQEGGGGKREAAGTVAAVARACFIFKAAN